MRSFENNESTIVDNRNPHDRIKELEARIEALKQIIADRDKEISQLKDSDG